MSPSDSQRSLESQQAAHRRIAALAALRPVHRAFQWLHLNELTLRRWQLEFLAIPAPPFGEAARAAWFVDRFRDLGLANPHLDAAGNALAELRPAPAHDPFSLTPDPRILQVPRVPLLGPGTEPPQTSVNTPVILLSAHLDTVFPPGTPTTPREDGPLIHAPGACDNGAGLTALLGLAAALRFAELTPDATILFAANVGEEGPGDLRGMKHLFGPSPYAPRIRAAIALEGAGDATVVDRALGSRRLRVTVTGPGGHSWADAGLPNPIVALSSALLAIARLRLPANPRTTLNVGTIAGGTSVNSVPAQATADLDLRSTSALELDRTELAVLTTLEKVLGTPTPGATTPGAPGATTPGAPGPDSRTRASTAAERQALAWHITRIGNRPAATLSPHAPLAHTLHAVDRHLQLATDARIGSTDANWPLSLGIPAIALGAGGTAAGMHTLAEWYDPTGRELALRRILLTILDTCSQTQTQTQD